MNSHLLLDNRPSSTLVDAVNEWCVGADQLDIATGHVEIGGLLTLGRSLPRLSHVRILMGQDVSLSTAAAFNRALEQISVELDRSLEAEKQSNPFLDGVDLIVAALRSGRIVCRVYRKARFHAKSYIVRGTGSARVAAVGSSNLSRAGLSQNVELNVSLQAEDAATVGRWFDEFWGDAEDVTADLLKVIERQVKAFSPFELYARSLHELFADSDPGDRIWDERQSQMFKRLDHYQQEGYRNLLRIGNHYGGALLCDGVGLGKTFVGMMLIERLIVKEGKNVVLLAPKGAVDSVWKPNLRQFLPRLSGRAFSNLLVAAHSDLGREAMREEFQNAADRSHVILIDEAHHFRNPGAAGTGARFLDAPRKAQQKDLFTDARRSRYRELFDLVRSPDGTRKQMFLLTATPINNSFHDLRHMIELFTQKDESYFGRQLGIYSLTAYFKQMEARLDAPIAADSIAADDATRSILSADPLVKALVVQRSRSFVKRKQELAGAPVTAFPPREPPHGLDYSLKKVYGRLLDILERSFHRDTPLFTLAQYYPAFYYSGPSKDIDPGDANRQKQVVALIRTSFLKRFESSVSAFRASCDRLVVKLLHWATENAEGEEVAHIADWRNTHVRLIEAIRKRQPALFNDTVDPAGSEDRLNDEADEDVAEDEFADSIEKLSRVEYRVGEMIQHTITDLNQLVEFYAQLDQFDHRNDDKLKKLVKLLTTDPVLSTGKVLIFSEFSDTAEYLLKRLAAEGITHLEQIDSRTNGKQRLAVIRRFSPYYNRSSSAALAEAGESEIRILISTDVLSEGLNLQDASRLINYDLHWNPVRLMQRIGRVDRRRNPDYEAALAADHPELMPGRQNVAFFNFIPPDELNRLLTLYSKITRKALRISRTLGIEGKKLLREDDDYQDLQQFNEEYDGRRSEIEQLELERDELFASNPGLLEQITALPQRIFSGRSHPQPGTQAIFFCYRLPLLRNEDWTTDGGPCRWFLKTLGDTQILDQPPAIAAAIRSNRSTPRKVNLPRVTLDEVRREVERHLDQTYFRPLGVPRPSAIPTLVAWMELN